MVYAISCQACDSVVYAGDTERTIKERMTEHLLDIRLGKDRPIKNHFGSGNSHDMAKFTVLEKLYGAARSERIIK